MARKICQDRFKILKFQKIALDLKFSQSCEILPNLVTLLGTVDNRAPLFPPLHVGQHHLRCHLVKFFGIKIFLSLKPRSLVRMAENYRPLLTKR